MAVNGSIFCSSMVLSSCVRVCVMQCPVVVVDKNLTLYMKMKKGFSHGGQLDCFDKNGIIPWPHPLMILILLLNSCAFFPFIVHCHYLDGHCLATG